MTSVNLICKMIMYLISSYNPSRESDQSGHQCSLISFHWVLVDSKGSKMKTPKMDRSDCVDPQSDLSLPEHTFHNVHVLILGLKIMIS